MTEITLRDYQQKAIDDITEVAVTGKKRILLQLPCGSGKTVLASKIIQHAVSNGNKVLFLAHRRELVHQTVEKLGYFGVEAAEMISGTPYVYCFPVVVASIATMHSWVMRRKKEFAPPADLVIVDESHRLSGSKTWSDILALYPDAIIIGLTATPMSKSGKGLAAHFSEMVLGPSIKELTDLGHLVPVKYFAPSIPDLTGIKIQSGDYAEGELEHRMDNPTLIGDILENWTRFAKDKKTVVFATGVKHSMHIAESFNAIGIKAVHIDGNTPPLERDRLLKDFSQGKVQVLCNCAVFCIDKETEILTFRGWVGMKGILKQDLVANWDQGSVYFSKPIDIFIRNRYKKERMVFLETERRSIRVSEDHNMIHRCPRGVWKKSTARDIVGVRLNLPISGNIKNRINFKINQPKLPSIKNILCRVNRSTYNIMKSEGLDRKKARLEAKKRVIEKLNLRYKQPEELSLDECRFIGFYFGDGSRCALIRGGVEYVLCQGLYCPHIISWVDSVISNCGFNAIKRIKKNCAIWSLCRGTGGGIQKRKGLFGIEPYLDKKISKYIWGLSKEQFSCFVEGLFMSDGNHGNGTKKPRSMRISGADKDALSRIQAIACVHGYLASISGPYENGDNHYLYYLTLRENETEHRATKYTLEFEKGWKEESLWCVKTKSGNIITRRHGKVTVMGNCEGWDSPEVECLVFARPTKSLSLYLQIAGRVLRPAPGKKSCTILDHSGAVYEHGLVSEPREWALTYNKPEKAKEAKKKKLREKKTITCKNCKCVYAGMLNCPECHWKPEIKGKYVDTYAAYLQALDDIELQKTRVNEQEFYQMLMGYCISKSKKPGLAYYKHIEKFGRKPQWSWKSLPPITPSLEVLAWIRSQNIRYHFRNQKAAEFKKAPLPAESTGKMESHGFRRMEQMGRDAYQPQAQEMDMGEPFA